MKEYIIRKIKMEEGDLRINVDKIKSEIKIDSKQTVSDPEFSYTDNYVYLTFKINKKPEMHVY